MITPIRVPRVRLLAEKKDVAVTANANILDSDIYVEEGFIILEIVTDTAGYPIIVKDGKSLALNEGNNLNTNALYSFWIPVSHNRINVQFSANATITLRLYFIKSI